MATTPARFPIGGVATQPVGHPMGHLGFPDPFKWLTFFDDFLVFTAADFTLTQATGSTVHTAGEGGRILLSTTAADNDFVSVQLDVAPFVLRTTGKKMVFSCRLTGSAWGGVANTNSAVFVGLSLTDTTPIADGGLTTTVTDGVYFFKPSASATVQFEVENGDAITSLADIATVVNATFVELAWVWNGVDKFTTYVDGVKAKEQTTITNIPTSADALNLTIAIKAGEAAVQTLTVDNVLVAQER